MGDHTQHDSENVLFFHKSVCIIFLLVSAGASLYLTTVFMFELGAGIGMAALFAIIGVMMDLFKSYAPTLMLAMSHRSKLLSLTVLFVFIGLVSVSLCASVFSLQNSVNSALSNTKLSQINQQKIEVIQLEIAGLRELQTSQLTVSHVSKASETAKIIDKKTVELTSLLDNEILPTQNGFLQGNSNVLIFVVSVLLEIISIVSSVALYSFSSKLKTRTIETSQDETKQDKTIQNNSKQSNDINPSKNESNYSGAIDTCNNGCDPLRHEETFYASTTTHTLKTREQVLFDMQGAILAGLCKPNQRDVYSNFKKHIKQKEVTVYLRALVEKNVLADGPNGTFILAGIS